MKECVWRRRTPGNIWCRDWERGSSVPARGGGRRPTLTCFQNQILLFVILFKRANILCWKQNKEVCYVNVWSSVYLEQLLSKVSNSSSTTLSVAAGIRFQAGVWRSAGPTVRVVAQRGLPSFMPVCQELSISSLKGRRKRLKSDASCPLTCQRLR